MPRSGHSREEHKEADDIGRQERLHRVAAAGVGRLAHTPVIGKERVGAPSGERVEIHRTRVDCFERLCNRHLHMGPAAFYLNLRVTRARELLQLTTMSVTEVAIACGFRTPAHFSTCYRRVFERSPRDERPS